MATRRKILIVDDEPHIVELLAMNLRMNGYDTCEAGDGARALELARGERPDLVLLDLMLPGESGLETCRRLRQDPRTARIPVIMLTAKSEESDKVIGLGIGADDYVTKPFGLRELMARIEVAFRHAATPAFPGRAEEGQPSAPARGLRVDEASREAFIGGARLALSPTEFELLTLLRRGTGRAFRRAELIGELGLSGADEEARSLDVHIRNLRRKLGPRPGGGEWIETVRGYGYRLDALE